ncbi:MAG: TonB-dependent receptor [Pseudomonadota bacterium]
MTLLTSRRALPAFQPLLLASLLSASFAPALAQTDTGTLPLVVVTASRFASDAADMPIAASVITAQDIRASGIDNVNQAIRQIGGVYGRQSSYGTQDFDLDLRGFGTNSSQNLVVLVDGVRLSENELSTASLSSIPIDTVERIEIMRGGSSVLYGDGATGGVIQVITKRPKNNVTQGSVTAEVGQFNHRALRASVAKAWDGFAIDAHISKIEADNFRDNNKVDQENFSGGAQWSGKDTRAGLRVDVARQKSGFAGALSLVQFEANPQQTLSPKNFGNIDTNRITAFAEHNMGALSLAAELSHRERKSGAAYFSDSYGDSISTYSGKQTQFSPRLRYVNAFGAVANELVAGVDLIRWNRVTDSSYSQADTSQTSKALYLRDEVRFGAARLALGARHEKFDKDSIDPAPYSTATYETSQSLNAWELQGSFAATPLIELFAKAGQSYRVANADENGYTVVPNEPIKPQLSHDLELGLSVGNTAQKVTARVFRHRLRDEIYYDPTANGGYGANTNLDPTRRQGLELSAYAKLAEAVAVSATLQHVSATFVDGPNTGREMVMVPKNTMTLGLNWKPSDSQSVFVSAQWADAQRYGGDFANQCGAEIPAFASLDARYANRFGAWEVAVSGTNLTDKNYFSNAYGCKSGIYPSAGRQLKLSARVEF